jgi:asparaginyl-tRNA synthetase
LEKLVKTRDALRLGEGARVRLRGWVYRKRDLGGKIFVVIRDSEGVLQVVVDRSLAPAETVAEAERADIEASVEAAGVLAKDPRAPGGLELRAQYFKLHGESRDFPIKGGEGIDYLLDVRHLWIRSRRLTAVWRIRHTVLKALREYLERNGWWEVSPPILTQSAVEGGATLFEVNFFGKKVYLSQSAQFYLEAMIFSLEKVWSLTTSFRAEKSRTRRHLYEYWHLEVEQAWAGMEELMKVGEEMVAYAVDAVLRERLEELSLLKRDTEKLEPARKPGYPRITYDEAIEILKRKGVPIEWGDDLGADEERVLTEEFDRPFFITHFPKQIKSFYMKIDRSRPEVVLSFDLLAPEGYGEIIGGSEREDDYERLYARIVEEGLNPADYQWYLDLRRYGSVQHAGFGLGVDRLVMWIAGLDHIRDSLPFPRFRDRIYP